MPAAANLTGLKQSAPEPAPGPAPGAAELFAALVAAIAPGSETPAAPPDVETDAAAEGGQSEDQDAVVDASILLPMLDQQRAASPAAIAVTIPQAVAGDAVETADPAAFPQSARAAAPVMAQLPPTETAAGPETPIPAPVQAAKLGTVKSETTPAPIVEMKAQTAAKEVPAAAAEPQRIAASPETRSDSPAAPPRIVLPPTAPAPAQPQVAPQNIAAALAGTAAVPATATAPAPAGKSPRQAGIRPAAAQPGEAAPSQAAPAQVPAAAAATAPAPQLPQLPAAPDQPSPTPAAPAQPGWEAAPANQAQNFGSSQVAMPTAAPVPAPAQNLGAAIATQLLDLARGGEWIDQLARDISRTAAADGTMRFRLAPETLGELRVEITHSERGAHVRLHVASEAAQQALAEAGPKLVQEARAQGVRIAEAEVSLGGGQSHGREASRQAQSEQPLRSLRGPAANEISSGDPSGHVRPGRTDLYA